MRSFGGLTMSRTTYRFENGKHYALVRYKLRDVKGYSDLPKAGKNSVDELKQEYADKWGIPAEQIKVTRISDYKETK